MDCDLIGEFFFNQLSLENFASVFVVCVLDAVRRGEETRKDAVDYLSLRIICV